MRAARGLGGGPDAVQAAPAAPSASEASDGAARGSSGPAPQDRVRLCFASGGAGGGLQSGGCRIVSVRPVRSGVMPTIRDGNYGPPLRPMKFA